MLREVLLVPSSAHPVEAAAVAAVVAGESPPQAVERQRPRIAASFGEELENIPVRVISPHGLTEERDASDASRTGASVHAVQPAVRTPGQTVGQRMRVFESESVQPHFGIAFRQPIARAVAIEEQIWRIHDPDTTVSGQY